MSAARVLWSLVSSALCGALVVAACGEDGGGGGDTSVVVPEPARLALDAPSASFGSVVRGDVAAPQTFVVTNEGERVSGTPRVGVSGAGFTIASHTCRAALAPEQTCAVVVTFAPRTAGAASGTLTVSASAGGEASAALDGEGLAPGALTLSVSGADQGDVVVGASGPGATVTVTNGGETDTGPLHVQASGANAAELTVATNGCEDEVLAPGATCVFQVAFVPASRGPKSAAFVVTGSPGGRATAIVSGRGLAPARFSVSAARQPFGTVVVGATSEATLVVANLGESGGTPAIAIGGADAAQFAASGCTGALASGAACSLVVTFAPTRVGPASATLVVVSPGGEALTTLVGSGVDSQLTVAPGTFAFAATGVGGASAAQSFSVTNEGDVASGPLSVALAGPDAGAFTLAGGTCSGARLAPGKSCVARVVFAPGAAGSASAELVVGGDVSGEARAGLTGLGLADAELAITPAARGFGSVPLGQVSPYLAFTVTNVGDQRSGALAPLVVGDAAFEVLSTQCKEPLAPGASCVVHVRFRPSALGPARATLSVQGNPGGAAEAALDGDGIDPNQLVVEPASFDFLPAAIGDSASQAFTITNTSVLPAGLVTLRMSGAAARDFALTHDCHELAPGARCAATVTFAPSAVGDRRATLVASGTPGGIATAALSGDGRAALTPVDAGGVEVAAHVDFGPVTIGSTAAPERDVRVRNDTAAAGAVTLSTRLAGQFTIVSNTCAAGPVASGASCVVRVRFHPTAAGPRAGELTFERGADRIVVTLGGVGVPALVIVPEVSADFGDVPERTTSEARGFLVQNAADAATSGALAVSVSGAGFRIVGNACAGVRLAPSQSCRVQVVFAAGYQGAFSGRLSASASPGGSATLDLSATGALPRGAQPTRITLAPSSVLENSPAGTVVGTLTASDPDPGETFVFTLVELWPDNASFEIVGTALRTRVSLNREAVTHLEGTRTLRVRVVDSGGHLYEETLVVTVLNVDEPTVLGADRFTVDEDSAPVVLDVFDNDIEYDAFYLSIASFTQPAHGVVALELDKVTLTYTPKADYCGGPDTFTYALDSIGNPSATVRVDVTCIDDPGVAEDDEITVDYEDGVQEIDVLDNDSDADGLPVIVAVDQPDEGTVVIIDGGAGLTYEPARWPTMEVVEFSYELDGGATATVTLTISYEDPEVSDDAYAVASDVRLDVDDRDDGLLGNDLAPFAEVDRFGAASPPTVTVNGTTTVTGTSGGTLLVRRNGTLRYDPPSGFSGTETFYYRAASDEGSDLGAIVLTTSAAP